ncbi:NTP transferase domain-containing protein [Anaerotardibacter muris]|uniref:NTP transferase domain-containing protein n=1 Tax=Anaerotardibacter muris TaxID=2941505 RepID=UPI0020421855|nr:NTP transferase domain-containing protein [Anaerotardibacter muris]
MLTKNEFEVLDSLNARANSSQRDIAQAKEMSVGSVNSALKSLVSQGLVEGGTLTPKGFTELNEHKVDNAVILAAGLSRRLAPISYEQPKGLLKVRGEVLIERQIEQLKDAGIEDITIVVGYKQELFFYLEDEYDVDIVINQEYATRNNNSSIMAVKSILGNTYICSSDDYFTENPFRPYVWKAYYAAQFAEGPTEEWCMEVGAGQRITEVHIGGEDAWYMIGQVYFDRAFSQHFIEVLEAEYDLPATADKLWEQLYVDHISEFDMRMKKYPAGSIFEFDFLDEVRAFDPYFLENINSRIFDNIEAVLKCNKNDIHDVYPLSQGLTNLSCHFAIGEDEYVYRHPGVGTEELIDRHAESIAQRVAAEMGLDNTYIFEDEREGWKISHFIANSRNLDPFDPEELRRAMEMAAQLHAQPVQVERAFDFFEESKRYEQLLGGPSAVENIPGYKDRAAKFARLKEFVEQDNAPVCLTHNDFFYLNFLIDEDDRYYLIDWEYSGMSDYASDFGTFVVCSQLSEDQALQALEYYYGRKPTDVELRHNLAFVAFAGWCWYVWSLYKESRGENVGEWFYIYYKYAKRYLNKALEMYEHASETQKEN